MSPCPARATLVPYQPPCAIHARLKSHFIGDSAIISTSLKHGRQFLPIMGGDHVALLLHGNHHISHQHSGYVLHLHLIASGRVVLLLHWNHLVNLRSCGYVFHLSMVSSFVPLLLYEDHSVSHLWSPVWLFILDPFPSQNISGHGPGAKRTSLKYICVDRRKVCRKTS